MLSKIKKILYRNLDNKEITYKRMLDMMKKDKDIILLDVRSKQEFNEGHLEYAINIPIFDLENQVENILEDKTKTIIVYCATGNRSKRAKEILEKLDYEDIYNLKNGLDGY